MTQQQPAQLSLREEERVLGIAYDRALPVVPRLVKKAIGADVKEYGDGYWVASIEEANGIKREVTVRLGRQGPDTRFSVRAETTSMGRWFLLAILFVGVLTMGLGILPMIPWINARQRAEQRERDLLVHRTFRAIEDAVAEQGAAPNYRVAPGAASTAREQQPQGEVAATAEVEEERPAKRALGARD